jgi:hypothetical protein
MKKENALYVILKKNTILLMKKENGLYVILTKKCNY